MKKYLYFFIAGLLSLNLLACNPVNGSTENSEDTGKTEILAEKKEIYSTLIGTKWIAGDYQELDVYSPKTISFEKDKFFWGDKTYSIDFNENFFFESEIDEDLIPHNLYNPIYLSM